MKQADWLHGVLLKQESAIAAVVWHQLMQPLACPEVWWEHKTLSLLESGMG